jgi:hypothetical protein
VPHHGKFRIFVDLIITPASRPGDPCPFNAVFLDAYGRYLRPYSRVGGSSVCSCPPSIAVLLVLVDSITHHPSSSLLLDERHPTPRGRLRTQRHRRPTAPTNNHSLGGLTFFEAVTDNCHRPSPIFIVIVIGMRTHSPTTTTMTRWRWWSRWWARWWTRWWSMQQ